MATYTKDFLIKMANDVLKSGNTDGYSGPFVGLMQTAQLEVIVDGKRELTTISNMLASSKDGKTVKVVEDIPVKAAVTPDQTSSSQDENEAEQDELTIVQEDTIKDSNKDEKPSTIVNNIKEDNKKPIVNHNNKKSK